MNIYIENEYDREIDVDYTDIINKVVCQAVDLMNVRLMLQLLTIILFTK